MVLQLFILSRNPPICIHQPPPYTKAVDDRKCPLWDELEARHAREVYAHADNFKLDHLRTLPM
jgi:hypothetical protein